MGVKSLDCPVLMSKHGGFTPGPVGSCTSLPLHKTLLPKEATVGVYAFQCYMLFMLGKGPLEFIFGEIEGQETKSMNTIKIPCDYPLLCAKHREVIMCEV